jgi:hypothetical protein
MEKRKIQIVGKKLTFAEAEEEDNKFYASLPWQKSVEYAEDLRKHIWGYLDKDFVYVKDTTIRKVHLKDLTDDFE